MNTNNKEALSLVRNFGFNHLFIGLSHDPNLCPECIKPHSLDNVVLQDNEDTEVQETPRCGDINCNSTHCVRPSSKVEKLKELKRQFYRPEKWQSLEYKDMAKLIQILIEDEE